MLETVLYLKSFDNFLLSSKKKINRERQTATRKFISRFKHRVQQGELWWKVLPALTSKQLIMYAAAK